VALNIGFLIAVLARSGAQVEAPVAESHGASESLRSSQPNGYTGYGNYYAALQSRGLNAEEAKMLVLARLEAHARELAFEPPIPYWQHGAGSTLASALRLSVELDQARAALVEVFGGDAEHEPLFARLYRPLDPMLSFMSSAQQVAVQRLKLEGLLAVVDDRTARAPVPAERMGTVLEPATLHEYLLRDSPLAEELRRSGVELTEAEFRETFDILQSLEESIPDAEVYAHARNALRAVLGGRRFAVLWAGRDPLFAVIQRVAENHALTAETVLSAYELFNDHQDALLEATRSANGDRQRQSQGVQEAQMRLETQLSGLVGAEVADAITRAHVQEALSLSRHLAHE
jgi:hypothetical protein